MEKEFSDVEYIPDNIKALIEQYGVHKVASVTGVKPEKLKQIYQTGECKNMRLCTLQRFSRIGVSIAELTLGDDIDTNWYADAGLQYLGENIRDQCKEMKISQTALAREIGITVPTLTRYIEGISSPGQKTLQAIADVLQIEVSDLFLAPVV